MDEIKAVLEKLSSITEEVNVDAVFGEPQEIGDRILIPVAELMYGVGAGAGSATGSAKEETDDGEPLPADKAEASPDEAEAIAEDEQGGVASGAGGGGGAKARPIAYIEVGPDGTRVQGIQDEQKITLAGIFLVVWTVGWLGLVLKTLFTRRS
jgi:uncharacterized spore protein YtfJ